MAEKKKSEKPKSESLSNSEDPGAPTPLGEIEQGPSKFEEFLEKNQKMLLIASLAIVLGASGWIVFKGMRESKETSAGEAIVAAKDIGDFRNVSEKFPGTPAAGTAQVLLAREQWADGLQDDAIGTLREFITNDPKHAARASARLALAKYLRARDQAEEASTILKELATDENSKHVAHLALIRLGDLENTNGNVEAARDYYTQAQESEETSGMLTDRLITSRLDTVGVSLPVTVPTPEQPKKPAPRIRPPLLPRDAPDNTAPDPPQIGRASCRERVSKQV